MATKAPITCHVLDTLTGRPAAGIKVHLYLDPSLEKTTPILREVFSAQTNSDGRVTDWTGTETKSVTIEEILQTATRIGLKSTIWRLRFDIDGYYGEGKSFWPEVNLAFYVKEGEHYHVPLLLGPYSYTTYRGS